jgi:signal transduction histidine kinase
MGYVEIIRRAENSKESPEYSKFLEIIDRNSSILLSLVESVLSLSKIDATEGVMKKASIPVLQVLHNSIFIIKPSAADKNQDIQLNSSISEDVLVAGDEGQLSQVFINLLSNAVKFSPEEAVIRIEVHMQETGGKNVLQISISDSGIGIPQEDLPFLFSRFFRARNAVSHHFPGTGLGLAIVSQVLNNHGGDITVQSEFGSGSTFTVTLPIFQSDIEIIEERREAVLERAIQQLKTSQSADAIQFTHSVGGAIAFYGFEAESNEILNFSRSLKRAEFKGDVDEQLKHLIGILEKALGRLKELSDGR